MPELPDLTLYVEALRTRVLGSVLHGVRISSPFLLRSVDPPLTSVAGHSVTGVDRLGKRVVVALGGDLFLLCHLMIGGRFRWASPGAKIPGKIGLAAFDFSTGTLLLTEAGTRRRASLHLVSGEERLCEFDRGGIEVLDADFASFQAALTRENHTLKRALTDPRLVSGVGNAYSDEILHRARLSPFRLTSRMTEEEVRRLHGVAREVLEEWTDRLREDAGGEFPKHVTAFREGMAVHGRFRKPCPDCGAPVQRIVCAENECNCCPGYQTGGRILADRALSRLLKDDWPRSLYTI